MGETTTRSGQYSEAGRVLFVAFELGWQQWTLGFTTGLGQRARRRTIPAGDLARLAQEIAGAKARFGLPAGSEVVSCYEAGRDGFWLHRYLEQRGVTNLVVDSASIEVPRRARRAKTDGLDVDKLAAMLVRHWLGEKRLWRVVRVPSAEAEDQRQLHRELETLKQERTRVANRIRGLLASQGLRVGGAGELRPARLAALRRWDGTALGPGLLGRLSRDCELLAHVQQRVRGLEAARQAALTAPTADRAVVQAQRLARLKGIGASGWDLVHECFGWRVFANRREVAGLVGLTPTPYDSGGEHHEQGISKAGNQRLRRLTVQLAWSWVRYQPQSRLAQWYQERFARAGCRARKIGIVAVARRLVIDLWRYLEYGVLPGGAVLKA